MFPTQSDRRSAIVVRGGWAGHYPVETTELFRPFLADQGFDIAVYDTPEVYADPAVMAGVDLIVQSFTMGAISLEAARGLQDTVARGAGLAGWHGGIVDAFRSSVLYQQLIGAQFVSHPSATPELPVSSPEENFVPHVIRMTELGRTHPVTRGVPDLELVTERYWVLADSYVDTLATTTVVQSPGSPWHRDIVSPAIWTRLWGRGRVFCATPGHDPQVLGDPRLQLIVKRGLLWASGADPTGIRG